MADTYNPMTDEELLRAVLADEILQYHFALNGGAGPVHRQGKSIFRAVERAAIEAYQRQQWISVEDRLPPAETDVLVKVASKQGPRGFDVAGIFRERWMSQATEDEVRWPVTHWMPLPPAPETQS